MHAFARIGSANQAVFQPHRQLTACCPQGAPETFRRLGQAESKMRAAMGGNLGALQCTHPRSETRVSLLEEELELMQEAGEAGKHRVLHSVPYWMLALVACVLVPGVSQVVV